MALMSRTKKIAHPTIWATVALTVPRSANLLSAQILPDGAIATTAPLTIHGKPQAMRFTLHDLFWLTVASRFGGAGTICGQSIRPRRSDHMIQQRIGDLLEIDESVTCWRLLSGVSAGVSRQS